MTLLVRNEEDIIRENLEFHFSKGVDFVVATDNLSSDSTPDILREYEKQGRLHMILEERDDYSQDVWVTRMARMAATQFHADWIINNDADEFWLPLRGNLKQVLGGYAAEIGSLLCPRLNFVCRPNCGEVPFWEAMVYRQAAATNALGMPLPPKACHRAAPTVCVGQGNHSAKEVPGHCVGAAEIEILHFPIRSWEQFASKIKHGGAAYARNPRLPPAVGGTWRRQYELLKEGTLKEHFNSLVPSDIQLAELLTIGELVEDRRLRKAISSMGTMVKSPS